jgi:methylenetetrahydrofolate reductase (NADPH)
VDTIQHLLQLPGVRGIHLMAPGFEHGVPEILDLAGMAHAH